MFLIVSISTCLVEAPWVNPHVVMQAVWQQEVSLGSPCRVDFLELVHGVGNLLEGLDLTDSDGHIRAHDPALETNSISEPWHDHNGH